MGIFALLLLTPIMFQHVTIKEQKIDFNKKNKRALTLFFVMLAVLLMFRHASVGNDTRNYILFFNYFSNMSWAELKNYPLELGFSYLSKMISLFVSKPQTFLAITAVLCCVLIYPTYKRLCIDASLTIALFCTMSTFPMMFSGIRQMLAIGIGFVAYEFTRNKKIMPFILTVLLAMTFHTSAFMLLFMYPLFHAKITKKWLLVVIPAVATVFVFNEQIFSVLSLLIERYTEYEGDITRTGAYTMIILFALFAVFSFLVTDDSILDKETIGLRNFLLLALILQMFAPLHSLAMRMGYYYIIFIPLLLPKIIRCRSKQWEQVAILARHVMVVFFLAYFFVNAHGEGNLNVFPYHFFWETVG